MGAKKAGQPTKYDPACLRHVRNLCLLGATNQELAESLDIGLSTLKLWMNAHPEFLSAIKNGREVADGKVAKSLYRRALGNATTPPDTAACFIWLKNRRPDKWRDKPEGSGRMTPEEIVALMAAVRDAASK